MIEEEFYRTYSTYLKEVFKEKVYKLPVKLNLTCPNRDGTVAKGGCIFCGEEGGSFENCNVLMNVREQVLRNKNYISKKYNAKKFIVYFQNFTNTYLNIDDFKDMILQSLVDDDIVGISVSTRPDCILEEQLVFLYDLKNKRNLEIDFELGLQSVNYKTLVKLNRGHTLAEFINAVSLIHKFGFRICTHIIIGLPWDNEIDVVESAKILSALKVEEVKLHSLYIVKNTVLGEMYLNGEIEMIEKEKFVDYVILFLRNLDKKIILQRLIGRVPEENSLFCNWSTSWWKIRDEILEKMRINNYKQGDLFNNFKGVEKKQ
ncbi:MAG: TIGR01212 family radical SAM protein [Peptoniphilaceae bacterium]|uniref:TIGR01212 family radical SAM protein n=1 Tax=Parvimonas sp. TaxID=1944660 RepID=UPI0025DD2618|nr:TIGR01212 family radical SAM protein [Parvimonas sp.]MCI5997457.1 TIGR01212 family radical SAM protein [Parvimonas sp.]MDD7764181.1 TIGR01212 family radical SAM protein [Peptoniphilaceae bacterium]MDY3050386.1 TIGR01212 family radical SAM protein [Parvimonas sp.]